MHGKVVAILQAVEAILMKAEVEKRHADLLVAMSKAKAAKVVAKAKAKTIIKNKKRIATMKTRPATCKRPASRWGRIEHDPLSWQGRYERDDIIDMNHPDLSELEEAFQRES